MPWYRVEIPGSDVAVKSANALMDKFLAVCVSAGAPSEARVYHGKSSAGDHIYLFSPEAAALAGDLLQKFRATPVSDEPGLDSFRLVKV